MSDIAGRLAGPSVPEGRAGLPEGLFSAGRTSCVSEWQAVSAPAIRREATTVRLRQMRIVFLDRSRWISRTAWPLLGRRGGQGFFHLEECRLGGGGDVATADLDRDLCGIAMQVGDQNRLDDLVESRFLVDDRLQT